MTNVVCKQKALPKLTQKDQSARTTTINKQQQTYSLHPRSSTSDSTALRIMRTRSSPAAKSPVANKKTPPAAGRSPPAGKSPPATGKKSNVNRDVPQKSSQTNSPQRMPTRRSSPAANTEKTKNKTNVLPNKAAKRGILPKKVARGHLLTKKAGTDMKLVASTKQTRTDKASTVDNVDGGNLDQKKPARAVVKGRNNATSDGTHEEEAPPKKRPNLRVKRDVVVESSPGVESDSDDEVPSTNNEGDRREKSEKINDDNDNDMYEYEYEDNEDEDEDDNDTYDDVPTYDVVVVAPPAKKDVLPLSAMSFSQHQHSQKRFRNDLEAEGKAEKKRKQSHPSRCPPQLQGATRSCKDKHIIVVYS